VRVASQIRWVELAKKPFGIRLGLRQVVAPIRFEAGL
jgi:hypothetical protein